MFELNLCEVELVWQPSSDVFTTKIQNQSKNLYQMLEIRNVGCWYSRVRLDMPQNSFLCSFHLAANRHLTYFKKITKMNNPLEDLFVWMFSTFHPFAVLTVGTFLLHETMYFGVYIPYVIADRIPAMQKYKIQPVWFRHNRQNNNVIYDRDLSYKFLRSLVIILISFATTHFFLGQEKYACYAMELYHQASLRSHPHSNSTYDAFSPLLRPCWNQQGTTIPNLVC